MLDFDGTLARIRPRPGLAVMDRGLRRCLARVSALPGLSVAVVSGRGMTDLRRRVPVPGLALASNHGLKISLKGLGPSQASIRRWTSAANRAESSIRPLLEEFHGLELEHKGPDLSLHCRKLPSLARATLRLRLESQLGRLGMKVLQGLGNFEIRPSGSPDKGDAALALAGRLAPGGPCIFAGDDRTDEDAFRAMRKLGPRCLGIKVGRGPTLARLRIRRKELGTLIGAIELACTQEQ